MKVAYKRCSTNEERQNVGRQLLGLEFDKVFSEYASGKNEKDRPIFLECLDYVKSGDELYFQDLSRAGRNAIELQTTVNSLIQRGIKVIFVSEGLTFVGEGGDPMAIAISKMLLAMLAAVNELFLVQTSVAIKQGMAKAKLDGVKVGGASKAWKESFHANKANHKPKPHHNKAREARKPIVQLIKDIIEFSADTMTMVQICNKLTERGQKTPTGKDWSQAAISRLIKQEGIDYKRKTNLKNLRLD